MAKQAELVVGAALNLQDIAAHRDWLFERDRPLEIQDFCDVHLISEDWSDRARVARQLLDGFQGQVGLHGPFYGIDLGVEDREFQGLVRKRLQQGLDACAAFGASQMVLHSPYSYWDHNNLGNWPGATRRKLEVVLDNLQAAISRAEDMGVELVLENIEDIDPAWRGQLVQAADSRALKLSIDTGHAHYAHVSHGAPPVDYFINVAGNDLAHVHLQDVDGYADRHWHPGEGSVPWHAVFAALRRLQRPPRLLLEVVDVANLRKGADYLSSLGFCV
ncbi:sugar phosphate isomerase/epimerase family protein [Polycladidibacter hongkongensis]|uniref:sugar phosphate isomerase/epimerase family protein n=1 Tax=Polycladidibacter hongkongensis TaxID=1647556 RepID=UPI00082D93E7|nr:sugar phosphate isomerase/epimerase family protein [Pseudovibrio hongkongensis]